MYVWLCMYDYVCMIMYVWLCMYDYVCMIMYVWLCMYDYVCMIMYVWLCMYDYVCMIMYVWLCMYDYVCMYVCNVCMYVCDILCIYINIYVCMYVCDILYVYIYDLTWYCTLLCAGGLPAGGEDQLRWGSDAAWQVDVKRHGMYRLRVWGLLLQRCLASLASCLGAGTRRLL